MKARSLFWEGYDRLIPMLRAVLLLAERTEARWRTGVKRGGSRREYGLRTLMARLAFSYRIMFGDVPKASTRRINAERGRETVPAGAAMDWHLGLFRLAHDRCREPAFPGADFAPARSLSDGSGKPFKMRCEAQPEYAVLAKLADRALGRRNNRETNTRDALAEWIKNGVVELRRWEKEGDAAVKSKVEIDD